MNIWEFLFVLFFVVPWILAWCLAAFDIVRRHDLRLWAKAIWLVVVLVVPLSGALVYLVVRATGAAARAQHEMADASGSPSVAPSQRPVGAVGSPTTTDSIGQLTALSALRADGTLTEAEFQQEKARILAASSAEGAAVTDVPTVSVPTVSLPAIDLRTAEPPATPPPAG